MLFFRSEERVREWCAAHNYPVRPLVTMHQLWMLATTWYSTRYNRTRGVPSPMRCVPFSRASAWKAIFGIRSRILSRNAFANKCWAETPNAISGDRRAESLSKTCQKLRPARFKTCFGSAMTSHASLKASRDDSFWKELLNRITTYENITSFRWLCSGFHDTCFDRSAGTGADRL